MTLSEATSDTFAAPFAWPRDDPPCVAALTATAALKAIDEFCDDELTVAECS